MIAGPPEIPGVRDLVELARGGFSTVYRGVQTSIGRVVAVKVLDSVALDEEEQQLFANEVAALGALSGHPSVVAIYDAGVTAPGAPYVVMEYLASGSLADRLRTDGPTDPAEIPTIGAVVAGALADAHDAGIVHGDVKPANLLLDQAGRVKLGDFGVATIGADVASRSYATAGFAAPEVLGGEPAGPASDVYALGATLYTLAVGAPPFDHGSDEEDHLRRVAVEPVPTSRLTASGIPAATAHAMTSALAKAVEDRPSAAELAGLFAETPSTAEPAVSRPGRPGAVVGGLVAGLVLLVGAGVFFAAGRDNEGASPEAATEVGPTTVAPSTVPRSTTSTAQITTTAAPIPPIVVVPGENVRVLETTSDTVWIDDGGRLMRLDPVTLEGEEIAWTLESSVGTVVSTDAGPWASTIGSLVPVDVERSSVGEPVRVFDEESVHLADAAGTEVWVGRILPGEIMRFDVERREFTGSLPVPPNRVLAVPVVGDGAVYVGWNQIGSPLTVARFDSGTLQQTAAVDLATSADGLAFHQGALWATDPLRGVVTMLDPESLEIVAEIPVGKAPETLASSDEELWVGVTGDRKVVRVDANALAVDAEIPLGDLPEAVEVGGGFVWVKTTLGDWTRYDAGAF